MLSVVYQSGAEFIPDFLVKSEADAAPAAKSAEHYAAPAIEPNVQAQSRATASELLDLDCRLRKLLSALKDTPAQALDLLDEIIATLTEYRAKLVAEEK